MLRTLWILSVFGPYDVKSYPNVLKGAGTSARSLRYAYNFDDEHFYYLYLKANDATD